MPRLALLALAAIACSVTVAVGLTSAATTQTRSLRADADGAFRFNKKTLTVSPGRVKIVMTNPSSSGDQHAIAVEGQGRLTKTAGRRTPARSRPSPSPCARAGRMRSIAPVGSHESLGMKGKIRVS